MHKYFTFLLLLCHTLLFSQQAIELGTVSWLRMLPEAKKKCVTSKKPIFILFQEIPGCSTCRNFGSQVMSHPLIAEIIETYFVPLAIHNNKGGHDAEVLGLYNEPSWNNPVMRIVDQNGKDVLPRLSGKYNEGAVITYLIDALHKTNQLAPPYIQLLEEEYNAAEKEMIVEMYCFWSGEKNIGGQKGVIGTEPGYSHGKEVVKVIFDQKLTSEKEILQQAKKTGNADAIHSSNSSLQKFAQNIGVEVKTPSSFTLDKDLHYYLKNSIYAYLPMTPMQATKINSALGLGQQVDTFLSPRQLILLDKLKKGKLSKKIRYDAKDLSAVWPQI